MYIGTVLSIFLRGVSWVVLILWFMLRVESLR